jgi:two-component system response regulator PilR (NtrC family)
LVETKGFREDLYYRLNVIPVHLPPLRERREDIPLLVGHFLKRFSDKSGGPVKTLTSAAQDKLFAHGFPGNARELENVIERAVALSPGLLIDAPSISFGQGQNRPAAATAPTLGEGVFDLEGYLASVERGLILQALERCNGNKTEAARILGLSFRSLRYRAEKLGL